MTELRKLKASNAALEFIVINPEYGFIIAAENPQGNFIGFVAFTYQWTEWNKHNGAYLVLEVIDLDSDQAAAIFYKLKIDLQAHVLTLNFKVCGVRFFHNKEKKRNLYAAMRTLDYQFYPFYLLDFDLSKVIKCPDYLISRQATMADVDTLLAFTLAQ